MSKHLSNLLRISLFSLSLVCVLPSCQNTSSIKEELSNISVLVNYSRTRNPQNLVKSFKLSDTSSYEKEQMFMQSLYKTSPDNLKNLVVVIGGFTDGTSDYAYKIFDALPQAIKDKFDIYYREHDENLSVSLLVDIYDKANKKVILIGHSWGGDCAISNVASKTSNHIDYIITLDPVSKHPLDRKLTNVSHWTNIYVDYSTAPKEDLTNLVARIGSPWMEIPNADENIKATGIITHDDPLGMLNLYGLQGLLEYFEKL